VAAAARCCQPRGCARAGRRRRVAPAAGAPRRPRAAAAAHGAGGRAGAARPASGGRQLLAWRRTTAAVSGWGGAADRAPPPPPPLLPPRPPRPPPRSPSPIARRARGVALPTAATAPGRRRAATGGLAEGRRVCGGVNVAPTAPSCRQQRDDGGGTYGRRQGPTAVCLAGGGRSPAVCTARAAQANSVGACYQAGSI